MLTPSFPLRRAILTTSLASLLFPSASVAANRAWNNSSTDYNAAGSWIGGLPVAADVLQFFATSVANPTLTAPATVSQMFFFPSASGYNLGTTDAVNNKLTVTSTGTGAGFSAFEFNAPGTTTLSAPIVLGSTGTHAINVYQGSTLVMSGDLSGTATGLLKQQQGTLTLSGNNTFGAEVRHEGQDAFATSRININSATALGTGQFRVGAGNGGVSIDNTSGTAITMTANNALRMENGFTFIGTNDLHLGNGVGTIVGTATINTVAGTLTLGGVLSGAALTKQGAGTLVLRGANTYTGTTAIQAGTLILDMSAGGLLVNNATVTFGANNGSGGHLHIKGASGGSSQTLNNPTYNRGASRITLDSNGGTGVALTLGNTWNRNESATLAIDLSTSGSTLTSTPAVTNSIITANNIAFATVTDAAGIGFATTSGGLVQRLITTMALDAASNASTTNFSTKINDPAYVGNVLTLGAGTHAFNTLQLDTSAGAGVLDLGGTTPTLTARGLLMTGTNGFTLQNGQLGANGIEIAVHQYSTGTLTIDSRIGGITKAGPGTVNLTSANTSSGATVVTAGVLNLSGSLGNSVVSVAGGTLNVQAAGAISQNTVTVYGAGTFNQTVANALSGTAALTVNGMLAVVNLSQVNSYSGATQLLLGAVNLGHAGAFGTSTVALNGATISATTDLIGANAVGNVLTNGGNSIFAGANHLEFTNTLTNTGDRTILNRMTGGQLKFSGAVNLSSTASNTTLSIDGGGSTLFSGSIANGGTSAASSLRYIGTGLLELAGPNTFGGAVALNGGVLRLSHASALPGGIGATGGLANLNISGGIVELANGDFLRSLGTGAGQVQFGQFGAGFSAFGGDRIVNFGGSGAAVTWGGTAFTAAGILTFGSPFANATVDLQNGLILGTTGTNNRVVRVFDGSDDVDALISGAITQTGGTQSLTKTGPGTLVLSNANTYVGATNVLEGTLRVSASGTLAATSGVFVFPGGEFAYDNNGTPLAAAITLHGADLVNRAVLGGSGSIAATVSLDSPGDVLAPGDSPGVLSFTLGQTWSAFSYDWETNDFTGTLPGTAFDQVALTGALSLTGGAGSYRLNLQSLTAGNAPGNVPNFSETTRSWNILTATGGITGFSAANWFIDTADFDSAPVAMGTWSLGLNGTNDVLVLTYTMVPEPSTAALLCIGGLLGLRRRRSVLQ